MTNPIKFFSKAYDLYFDMETQRYMEVYQACIRRCDPRRVEDTQFAQKCAERCKEYVRFAVKADYFID